jgi:hypothetical protein
MIYNFLYLCKFNYLLNEIFQNENEIEQENKNILLLWLTLVLNLFNINVPFEVSK